MALPEELRARTGFHAWLAWYDGIGDWAKYGPRHPDVRPNVPRNIRLQRPTWFSRRKLWWEARLLAEQMSRKVELTGVIRTLGSCTVDHPEARAFIAAGGSRVIVQFADPSSDAANRVAMIKEAPRWRAHGVRVDGWWRVEHLSGNLPPNAVGLDGWWPNAEQPHESGRLPSIYGSPCAGVIVQGKQPAVWPPAGGLLSAECFRESAASDHTVAESVRYWRSAGLPLDRLMTLLQAYGTPFAALPVQAAEAHRLGVRQIGIYPLDGADPAQILALDAALP